MREFEMEDKTKNTPENTDVSRRVQQTVRHELKIWPQFYKEVFYGRKNFEIRKNDRDFEVGDFLVLREFDISKNEYTGASVMRKITFILHGNQFVIEEGYCVMSITGQF